MTLIKAILGYLMILATTLLVAHYTHGLALHEAVLHFDAEHYYTISRKGYEGFLQAFFPLFPLIWKLLDVGPLAISAINGAIYLLALIQLQRELRLNSSALLFWLVIPSAFFYWLPYSESFFFLGSTLLLIGTRRAALRLSVLGLLICTLTRPAFTILIPALVLTEILHTSSKSDLLKTMTSYLATTFIGLGAVAAFQWHYTKEWFGFYHVQQGWGNSLRFPTLPLTSWGGSPSVRLDAVAFLVGVVATIILGWHIFKDRVRLRLRKELTLSLFYLSGISVFVLFMRGGELFSLNRFVFATPYLLVALSFCHSITIKKREWILLGLAGLAFFLLFGSFEHIQTFISYLAITTYILLILYYLTSKSLNNRLGYYSILIITLGLQLYYFLRFLNGGWVA